MLMPGVFDLNSTLSCTDSLKEDIKQTMLKQEVIFRKQVYELHRLYRMQTSLMEDLNHQECGRFKVSASLMSQELLESRKEEYYRLQQRPFDLQLSADDFINKVEENLPEEGKFWNHLNQPLDFMFTPSGRYCSGTEDLELSLSIGKDDRRAGDTRRAWFDEKTHYYSHNVIDLEEPAEKISEGYPRFPQSVSYPALETYASKSIVSASSNPIISNNMEKSQCHGFAESTYLKGHSEYFQEHTSFTKGIRECRDNIRCFELSAKLPQCTRHQSDLDLNKLHDDDSSNLSDPALVYPSSVSSADGSGVIVDRIQDGTYAMALWTKEGDNCSNGTSDVLPEEKSADLTMVDLNSQNNSTGMWLSKPNYNETTRGIAGPEFSRPQVGNEDPKDNVDLDTEPAHTHLCDSTPKSVDVATREASCEKSEVEDAVFSCSDQSQNTFQAGHGNKSPDSSKSCISDNDSVSLKQMNSGIISSGMRSYSEAPLGSQVTNVVSYEHNHGMSDVSDMRSKCRNRKEELTHVDTLIQGAAESLINMSMENSATLFKEVENEEREQPQCSFDSFELITMNLTHCNENDNSVSSKPYEVTDAEMKDFGFKLRRGRRMKDFQKEILPGLASLSRHEICEDINIMEGVLRSREYRKMRAKMATDGQNCFAMLKSRRPRLGCTGRRNFSWKFS